VRYVTWVGKVFHALGEASRGTMGAGVSLRVVGEALGLGSLTDSDYTAGEGPGKALMTAMIDLDQAGVVDFKNVSHGNALTSGGRDLLDAGLASAWDDIFGIAVSADDRTFLAGLYRASAEDADDWADLRFVDADPIYAGVGFPTGDYADTIARIEFYGDLERKRLIRPESRALGSVNMYRPTYLAAVLVTEADTRNSGARAGLIDWSIPTAGFDVIEERLAALKVNLEGAATDDDLSGVGLRCRDLLIDVMKVVYRPDMLSKDGKGSSPKDAEEMFAVYLTARLPGKDHEAFRLFLRGTWALASARVHSGRGGRPSAVAAAQATLSFIRTVQALERAPRVTDIAAADVDGR
jgi:hypothetical protein